MEKKGPYREMPDQDALALKKMEKEIAAEGKFVSFPLPKNIKTGDPLPFFEAAILKKIKPEEIVFYSLETGILKHAPNTGGYPYVNNDGTFYQYKNGPYSLGIIFKRKKAKVNNLFSNETRKRNEEYHQNLDKIFLSDSITKVMSSIKSMSYVTSRMDKDTIEKYLPDLKEAKTKLDNLINGLENKSEPEK